MRTATPFLRPTRFSPWLLAAFCLLPSAFCLLPSVRADIQQPPRAHAKGERQIQRRGEGPATALGQDVQVEAGSSVEITLRGEGQAGKSLNFFVRQPPGHGTISGEPVRVSRNAATVLYVPTPGDDATDDEFTFCAQVPGGAVSAPQTVRLRLLPPPPSLVVTPAELDFGAVKAGESAQAQFTLENRGGSVAVGRVDPPAPFVLDGPAAYRLARGAKQTFRLVFHPGAEQVYNNALHFRFEAGDGVRLIGTGLGGPGVSLVSRTDAGGAATQLPGLADGGNGTLTVYPVVSAAPPPPQGTPAAAAPTTRQESSAALAGGPGLDRTPGGSGALSFVGGVDTTDVPINKATVEQVQVRAVGRSTVELAWKSPVPRPASYRVELEYIVVDDDKARADWRPYAQAEVVTSHQPVTAHVRGLPSNGLQRLRVVAVDGAGRFAAPSPVVTVMMEPAATWWRPTLLKVLVGLLLVCGGLAIRKRWEDQQILAEIDESRRRSNAESGVLWRT